MEKRDLELLQKYISSDPELKRCRDEHQEYEQKLEEMNRRLYLTPEENPETETRRPGSNRGHSRQIPISGNTGVRVEEKRCRNSF